MSNSKHDALLRAASHTKTVSLASGKPTEVSDIVAAVAHLSVTEGADANLVLIEHLRATNANVGDEILKSIDNMALVFDQKSESIEALRSWRKTVETECLMISAAVDSVMRKVTPERLSQLKELVVLLERLNAINPGLLVGRLFETEKEPK